MTTCCKQKGTVLQSMFTKCCKKMNKVAKHVHQMLQKNEQNCKACSPNVAKTWKNAATHDYQMLQNIENNAAKHVPNVAKHLEQCCKACLPNVAKH
jgi:hypothetical protein